MDVRGPDKPRLSVRRRIREGVTKAIYVGRRRRGGGRRTPTQTLVVAENRLMFDYVKLLWDVAAELGPAVGYAFVPDSLCAEAVRRGLIPLGPVAAHVRAFDVILLANHAPAAFDPYASRVIVPHGPIRGTKNYYYDPKRIFWGDGRPVYDLMIDVSEPAVDAALQQVPSYAGRIAAVGDLRTYQLVRNSEAALASNRPRVALMSTWGPNGLLEQHGEWLLPAVKALAEGDKFAFTITAHQNVWAGRLASRDWGAALSSLARAPGIRVVGPDDDWTEHLADSAVAISDHTSLAGSFSATGKPILPVSIPEDQVREGSFFEALTGLVRPLTKGQDVGARLEELLNAGMPAGWLAVREHFMPDRPDVLERTKAALAPFFPGYSS
jgi:hypothetical protein